MPRSRRPRTINPRIPETLERVVMKALERDPEDRYQDAARDAARPRARPARAASRRRARDLARFLELLSTEDERERAASRRDRPAAARGHGDRPADVDEPPTGRAAAGAGSPVEGPAVHPEAAEALRHQVANREEADAWRCRRSRSQFYQQTLEMTRKQIERPQHPDRGGAGQGEGAPGRAAERQERRQADLRRRLQILGVENDLEKEDEARRRLSVAWFRREHDARSRAPEQESRVPEGL